jgi:hypothetical protein
LHSHGKTLRQLTASSTTINALLEYLEGTSRLIAEEWIDVEKARMDSVSALTQYLNEDPEDKPMWWNDDEKTDVEGALLSTLMTCYLDVGVINWFQYELLSVVRL